MERLKDLPKEQLLKALGLPPETPDVELAEELAYLQAKLYQLKNKN